MATCYVSFISELTVSPRRSDDDELPRKPKKLTGPSDAKVASLRNELEALLGQQLMARGVSAKYPTSGSRVVIDDLIANSSESRCVHAGPKLTALHNPDHSSLLGAPTAKAHEDIDASRSTKKNRKFVTKGVRKA